MDPAHLSTTELVAHCRRVAAADFDTQSSAAMLALAARIEQDTRGFEELLALTSGERDRLVAENQRLRAALGAIRETVKAHMWIPNGEREVSSANLVFTAPLRSAVKSAFRDIFRAAEAALKEST